MYAKHAYAPAKNPQHCSANLTPTDLNLSTTLELAVAQYLLAGPNPASQPIASSTG